MTDFDKNTYQTPKDVFRWLSLRYAGFHIDGCSNGKNALCLYWIGKADNDLDNNITLFQVAEDFLANNLVEELLEASVELGGSLRIFVNPPYSDPLPFVQRAAELKEAGHLVVMLLPADKTTEWYTIIQQHANEVIDILGYHDEKGSWRTGRIQFINPVTGKPAQGNNKGSMIVVFDPFIEGIVTRQMPLDKIKEWGR
ncbi:DNA N-6-adenine-methyltransferase [Mannheimia indoligenes]|uniref:DNA N-6-adenine-methyltransferase n=1 Tax=Mannheimia indoligenes TaxID=3103145 RepID=UPI002FE63658